MRLVRGSWRVLAIAVAVVAAGSASVTVATVGLGRSASAFATTQPSGHSSSVPARPASVQEFAVGAPVERNGLEIAAN
jgi:hypothetical protein